MKWWERLFYMVVAGVFSAIAFILFRMADDPQWLWGVIPWIIATILADGAYYGQYDPRPSPFHQWRSWLRRRWGLEP